METLPFDPAEYLDSEEAIAAYLDDARQDGDEATARAAEVVTRARRRMDLVGPTALAFRAVRKG